MDHMVGLDDVTPNKLLRRIAITMLSLDFDADLKDLAGLTTAW
jgi:hypothetical protein